jgi:hypothetical protein
MNLFGAEARLRDEFAGIFSPETVSERLQESYEELSLTRLISRWRQDWPKTAGTYVWLVLADPGAFVMEQKMLRRIRDLAEEDGAARRIATRARISAPAGAD